MIGPDGPFAYPGAYDGFYYQGMTLRDYFAAKAMHASLSRAQGILEPYHLRALSISAYEIADAMLAERERNNP